MAKKIGRKKITKYRKAVFIVVYTKTNWRIKYLILKRKLHWKGWEFPKGAIEKLETKRMAVKRELKEETGLKPIKITRFKEKGSYKYKKLLKDRPGYRGQTYDLFLAEVGSQDVVLDKVEHSEYMWLPFKVAYKKLKWPNQKKCFNIVNNWLTSR